MFYVQRSLTQPARRGGNVQPKTPITFNSSPLIPVTKPFLPPRQDFDHYIDGVWQRNWLTNNVPLVNELELRLKDYLGVKHLLFVSNGTIALETAIKALNLKGEFFKNLYLTDSKFLI